MSKKDDIYEDGDPNEEYSAEDDHEYDEEFTEDDKPIDLEEELKSARFPSTVSSPEIEEEEIDEDFANISDFSLEGILNVEDYLKLEEKEGVKEVKEAKTFYLKSEHSKQLAMEKAIMSRDLSTIVRHAIEYYFINKEDARKYSKKRDEEERVRLTKIKNR